MQGPPEWMHQVHAVSPRFGVSCCLTWSFYTFRNEETSIGSGEDSGLPANQPECPVQGKVAVIPSALKESDAAILGASALAW